MARLVSRAATKAETFKRSRTVSPCSYRHSFSGSLEKIARAARASSLGCFDMRIPDLGDDRGDLPK